MNNVLGEPMGDYGRRAYLETGELKNELDRLRDMVYALAKYMNVELLTDKDGNIKAIKLYEKEE